MHLNLEKLTVSQKLFEPFGDVISKGMENNKFLINQGYCERFDEVATVQVLDKKANPIISIFSATPRKRPIKIDWQVVVANDKDGSPDLSSIKYFEVPGDVGINYNPKVWHFPLLVNTAQDFLVIDRSSVLDAGKENLREFFFHSNGNEIYIE